MNVTLAIPGIRHGKTSFNNWTDRFALLALESGDVHCLPLEYHVGLYRSNRVRKRLADELAVVIRRVNKMNIRPSIVTHSNGAVIFCQALQRNPDIEVSEFHAIAPAAWECFGANGLNEALRKQRILEMTVYASKSDLALKYGGLTALFKFLGKGYGRLGYNGPRNVDNTVLRFVHCQWGLGYNHSGWLGDSPLESIFNKVRAIR